jgi:short-subunit dehydrogenase
MALGTYPELSAEAARRKYGPWAVIAGASDGTGAAYARSLAGLGINLVLIARREAALAGLAAELQAAHGVQTRILVQDLMEADAGGRILAASADLDVGLYISNAGADGGGSAYVGSPADRWLNVINMNVRAVAWTAHGFAQRMTARGAGGILLMSSLAALGGQPWLAIYSATKAFEMVLAEALWAELAEAQIDVLAVLAPAMNTPTFQAGVAGTDYDLAGVFEPEDVVREALAHLPHGPLLMYPFGPDAADVEQLTAARLERLNAMAEIGKSLIKKA